MRLRLFSRNPLSSGEPTQRSLFGEILDWMLAPLLLLWPMSIGVTYLIAKSIANTPFDRALDDSVTVLAQQVRVVEGRPSLVLPISAKEILRADDTDSVYFQIVDSAGKLIAGDKGVMGLPDEDQPSAGVVQFRNESPEGRDIRIAYLWVDLKLPKKPGLVLVQVAETLDKRNQLANEIIKGVIFPQFVILPIAVILVWFGLSRGISPLNVLQEIIRNRRPEDLSALETRNTPEELVPLISALNDQLARLEQNLQTQKRFIADAAHQLKTPLAGLRMQVELLSREKDPVEIDRSLTQLAQGTDRATRLVNQMLSLARTEAPPVLTIEKVDLVELARHLMRDFVPDSMQKQIDLGFEAPDYPVYVRGQSLMLSEMLKNLVDNALRYTPAGGTVTVRIEDSAQREAILIEVEDTGPGIPESDRPLVFDRFYRVLGTSVDGSGLGLAIVKEIVQQHNAGIHITNNPRSSDPKWPGTLIRVSFPQASTRLAQDH